MTQDLVVVEFAAEVPADYLPGIRSGMIVGVQDLDLLPHHPTRPAIALPTDRSVMHGPRRLPVYEIHALGDTGGVP